MQIESHREVLQYTTQKPKLSIAIDPTDLKHRDNVVPRPNLMISVAQLGSLSERYRIHILTEAAHGTWRPVAITDRNVLRFQSVEDDENGGNIGNTNQRRRPFISRFVDKDCVASRPDNNRIKPHRKQQRLGDPLRPVKKELRCSERDLCERWEEGDKLQGDETKECQMKAVDFFEEMVDKGCPRRRSMMNVPGCSENIM
ncbi:hypothetical protein DFH08DRAFT_801629 [Mycena albidolilacea]|uniref:Uncharacterized protein n=1 Tax=Mycena albidolilacea TaxID=1033008 RepID=A0AAD7AJ07_9AGAR|nr:hypothetical protein DFH08DRAFT_801629 [Mycena albidolilacea]